MTDELRSCARTGCRWPAAASLSFRYDTRQVWLVDLPDARDPTLYDLCPHHARTLTVPRGWEHADERTNPPAPQEPAGRALAARAPVRHGEDSRYAPLLRDLPRIAAELAGASAPRNPLSPPPADPIWAEEPVAEHPGQLSILLESGLDIPGALAEPMRSSGPVVSIESGGARRRLLSRGQPVT
jgi:hypothetical protein